MYQSYGRADKGNSTLLFPNDYVVLDIETTGLSPQTNKIIELSAIKVSNKSEVERFSSLVNPGTSVNRFIQELTGITNEMLKIAEPIDVVLPKFLEFIGDSHLVGHNVNFDINFIYDNCITVLNRPLTNDFTDTMRLSKRLLKELPHHRLSDLAEYFCVSYQGAHRALVDCEITNLCYQKLLDEAVARYGSLERFYSNI